jgi:AcrR family transcriptional regulator
MFSVMTSKSSGAEGAGGRPARPARRRAPAGERRRDPERTKERILQAALVEFGEHGYAGARIAAIAERAGVNQQLISYYFDGKAGLADALNARWREISSDLDVDGLPLASVVDNFLRYSVEQRSWSRLLVWQGLTGAGEGTDPGETDTFFAGLVDDVRRRQEEGDLADDLDPGYAALFTFAAAIAPVVLPQVARRLTGLPADSPEFLEAYSEQLGRLIGHLAD